MDDVIGKIYGFERGSIGYRYVRTCLKRQRVVHPWKFLTQYYPTGTKSSTSNHLARACEIMQTYHPSWKFIY